MADYRPFTTIDVTIS